jgi:RNA-directed DNA polymerase
MFGPRMSEEEVSARFNELQQKEDVSTLLEVDYKKLRYLLFVLPPGKRYVEFKVPKKSAGNFRTILAPNPHLKSVQKNLNKVLQVIYKKNIAKPSVHGFLQGKSIITNARCHVGRKCVLNLDLKDFFPCINFGRVRGLLLAKPYECKEEVATFIAQICCFENRLPQGAPTSPVISNMICAKLDSQLQRLAKKYGCFYTRYADDITISSFRKILPSQIAAFSAIPGKVILGREISGIINLNGFQINEEKTRLRTNHRRQEVTGLVVNKKLNVKREYIRTIRVMLHVLEKNMKGGGVSSINTPELIKGKIEFLGAVRGYEDSIYLKFLKRLHENVPGSLSEKQIDRLKFSSTFQALRSEPEIWTEGKTDVKHLKQALRKLQDEGNFRNLQLDLQENVPADRQGYDNLLIRLKFISDSPNSKPIICIFDRDIAPKALAEVHDDNKGYKSWGNRVYSLALPIPSHRHETKDFCIEHYYTDDEIKTKDSFGRRLFLFKEFDLKSHRHQSENNLSCTKHKGHPDAILDTDVYDEKSNNVALTKDKFASYILEGDENFKCFNFSEFSEVFKIIYEILIFDHRNN